MKELKHRRRVAANLFDQRRAKKTKTKKNKKKVRNCWGRRIRKKKKKPIGLWLERRRWRRLQRPMHLFHIDYLFSFLLVEGDEASDANRLSTRKKSIHQNLPPPPTTSTTSTTSTIFLSYWNQLSSPLFWLDVYFHAGNLKTSPTSQRSQRCRRMPPHPPSLFRIEMNPAKWLASIPFHPMREARRTFKHPQESHYIHHLLSSCQHQRLQEMIDDCTNSNE